MTNTSLLELKTKTVPIFRRYEVLRAGVFGSYARGEAKKTSDIDFLIKFGPNASLFTLGGLQYDLEKELKKEIDLVSSKAIKKGFEPNIKKDLVNLYEKGR